MIHVSEEAFIRPFKTEDRSAVRDIAYRTAFRRRGERIFPGLAKPVADYLTLYYTDHEPRHTWVLENEGRVTGYLLGCSDTQRYIRLMATRVIPLILCAIPLYLLKSESKDTTGRFMKWFLLHSWREVPSVPVREFPAHCHFNLLPGSYGLMYASRLLLAFLEQLNEREIQGVHFAVTERERRGAYKGMADRFVRHYPQTKIYYRERRSSFHSTVFGNTESIINRVWGMSVRDLTTGVSMMASLFHL